MKFDPSWLPTQAQLIADADEWSEIPDGRGNITMAAFAGTMRKQGMAYPEMLKMLLLFNKVTMKSDPMPGEMVEQIARSVARYAPDPDIEIELDDDEERPEYDPMAAFLSTHSMPEPEPMQWLWHPYLPEGRLTMIEGEEGIGKGMFAVWLALRVAAGAPFEKGGARREPRPVLWFSSEDDPQEDIFPRMLAAGYNREKHQPVRFQNLRHSDWHFPNDRDKLMRVIERVEPGLIIFDPGRSYLAAPKGAEVSFNSEAALRPGMQSLLHLSHDTHTTLLFVHHRNKKSEGSSREKSTGSGVFRQVARHVLVFAQRDTKRAFAVDKANHAEKAHTVRSWNVEPVEGTDTAKFTLGERMRDYVTIDEWDEVMKRFAAEPELEIDTSPADLCLEYATLDAGTIAPTAAQIAKDVSVAKEEAQRLRAELVREKIIDANGRWQGCAGGSAEGETK